jgi:outer membrane protein OmpA-like peptidoglycan-associated protein
VAWWRVIKNASRARVWRAAIIAAASLLPVCPVGAQEPQGIPLVVGLAVTAVNHIDGVDREMVQQVVSIDNVAVTFSLHRGGDEADRAVTVTRVVNRSDLENANRIVGYFHAEDPELFPGSTAFQASAALLRALKAGDPVPFVLGAASGPFGTLGARKYFRGSLQRIEPEPVPYPVLLDGVRATLPAVHVKGELEVGDTSGEGEFWFLDQPDNALMLKGQFRAGAIQVVRIDVPAVARTSIVLKDGGALRAAGIAAGLETDGCRGELTGVYFDSGSAVLLRGSEIAIADAAALLEREAAWEITVEGHTDSVDDDAANQALSEARAAAVRDALIAAGVAAERLTAVGFGEMEPVESNETIEGRAHNRRVELSRKC